MPHVSVVIPCYNSHQYLQEAIDSVKRQTFKDYEMLVVNDGSTDPETIHTLDKLDPSIKVLTKENGGLAAARNFGINNSSGEVIITLDSDDKFAPDFFKEAIEILNKEKETGIVSSYVQEFGAYSKLWRTNAYDDFSFLTENRLVACCAFRKRCWEEVGGYDENMRLGYEDWEFWIRITQKSWKVHVIPKPLFFYRKSEGSMLGSQTKPRMSEIIDYMMHKHHDWYLSSLKKGIIEKQLLNKKNLTRRRIFGLLIEKLTGKF